MTRPDAGEIRINGRAVALRSNRDAIAAGIAYVPEDRLKHGLVLDQPISANLLLTVFKQVARSLRHVRPRQAPPRCSEWITDLAIKVSIRKTRSRRCPAAISSAW